LILFGKAAVQEERDMLAILPSASTTDVKAKIRSVARTLKRSMVSPIDLAIL
jgi:hypothetical protein